MFENLLTVLTRIADALEAKTTESTAQAAAIETAEAPATEKKAAAKGKTTPAKTEAAPAKEAKAEKTEATGITVESLQSAALEFAKANTPNGKAAVEAVLAPYGALKIKDLDPEHYAAVLLAFTTPAESEEF